MGGKSKTKTQQNNTIDPYSRQMIDGALRNARGYLSGNPFESYGDNRVAGITDTQRDAKNVLTGGMGGGMETIKSGADLASQVTGYTPERIQANNFNGADLSGYQNPFQQQVIDVAMRQIDKAQANAQGQLDSNAAKRGAFGDRRGIAEAEVMNNFDTLRADTAATLASEGFDKAANLFNMDANRNMQADTFNANMGLAGQQLQLDTAGLMGSLGRLLSDNNRADASLLNYFGQQEQATEQRGLDAAYEEFLREQDDPFRRAAIEMGIFSGAPRIVDSTGTQTTRQTPGIGQIAGLGLQAASLFSDRRLKTDIEHVGKRGKHDWYSFRYVWDAPETRREGVMSDDVSDIQPDAVSRHTSGYDVVDYSKLELAA